MLGISLPRTLPFCSMYLTSLLRRSIKTRVTLFTLAIFLLSLWSLAFYASGMLRRDMQHLLGEQQFSAASNAAAHVERELGERIAVLEKLAKVAGPALQGRSGGMQTFLNQQLAAHSLFNAGVLAFRSDGTAVADTDPLAGRVGVNYADVDTVARVLKDGASNIGPPVIGKQLGQPVFGITVAIRDAQGRVIGALTGVTQLKQVNFIDQATEGYYGRTGSFVLVAPQYRMVVTSTDKSRIMTRLPPLGSNPALDRFVQGYEGSGILNNPMGLEVLASAKRIPVAGWYMVAQMPTAEAFAPIANLQQRMLLATLVLTLLAGGLTRWMLKRQLSPLFSTVEEISKQSHSQDRWRPLPIDRNDEIGRLIGGFNGLLETLAQRESLLSQVLDTSSVAIFVVDLQGRITQANRRMADMFNCTPASLVGREYVALVHPSERDQGRQKMLALLSSQIPEVDLERLFVRANQTEFWGHLTGKRFIDTDGTDRGLVGVIEDIDDRRRVQAALQDSEQRYRTIIEWLPEPIGVHRDGKVVYVNPAAVQVFGARTECELIGRPIASLVHPESRAIALARAHTVASTGQPAPMVAQKYLRLDGGAIDVEVQATRIVFDGQDANLIAVHDVTARKQDDEKLQLAAKVFSHAREAIMITAPDGSIVDVNEAFTRITGYDRDEVLGKNPRLLSSGRQGKQYYATMWHSLRTQGHWYGEVWNRRKNGEVYAEMQTISAVRDSKGELQHYVALFSDITASKVHEEQLERIAHFDALTGMPNRVLLADRLHQAMAQSQRRGQHTAVAFLDLDGFKAINDHHGHDAGDELLIALATRMKQTLRDGDTLARMGGDEFVAVLVDLSDPGACVPMLSRLLAAAAQPVEVGGLTLQVSASLGVTFYPQAEEVDADQLLRQADQAMYQAKQSGKNRYHVFDAEQDRSLRGHHESLERIGRALADREFVLYYQPKVNMRTGQVIGAEALIRWQHPELGLLAPAAFLPVIEDHPLAIDIGEWVIDTALTQLEIWQLGGLNIPVSVNVGARQLQQEDFIQRLRTSLAAHPRIPPSQLELEVLETSALADVARVSQVIETCRELGMTFALDDFGTGYSSLTYLKRLPATLLKIDQSFVRDMLDDADDLAILDGVIGLASAFRREVIAEGVETIAHGELLMQLGCDLAQGYGIARPMPASTMPGWAAQWRPDPAWHNVPWLSREELPLLFARVEHRAWLKAMEHHLKGERDTPPQLDHRQCHFGQWLAKEGLVRHGTHALFATIDTLHQQAHAMASAVHKLHIGGEGAAARERMDVLHGISETLLDTLTGLRLTSP